MKNAYIPDKSWSLQALGEFVQANIKQTAESFWKIGRAYSLAKDKIPRGQKGNELNKWREQYCPNFSSRTLDRWAQLCKSIDYDSCVGANMNEPYRRSGIPIHSKPIPFPAHGAARAVPSFRPGEESEPEEPDSSSDPMEHDGERGAAMPPPPASSATLLPAIDSSRPIPAEIAQLRSCKSTVKKMPVDMVEGYATDLQALADVLVARLDAL